ncbi:hypothetical protein [Mycolicibacterium iranicum]|uniref:STAS domain-containing protein n=1 Tax=Mycolicibacterium iranicum TaxID=912594 RepID=A0A178LRI6_MYCIR|nr:hypothetical protein [Mycolicibacterium iranicum]OAN34470.1 hypothetical protein A4X20_07150 [Mycolicibacterium iranicum]
MSVTIVRPGSDLGPLEAIRLRDHFALLAEKGHCGIIIDLTGVRRLSGAGVAAVTNVVTRGARSGISVRVLLPEEGSPAARFIDQADLRRFLRPGGVWSWRVTDIRSTPPHADTRGGLFRRRQPTTADGRQSGLQVTV